MHKTGKKNFNLRNVIKIKYIIVATNIFLSTISEILSFASMRPLINASVSIIIFAAQLLFLRERSLLGGVSVSSRWQIPEEEHVGEPRVSSPFPFITKDIEKATRDSRITQRI